MVVGPSSAAHGQRKRSGSLRNPDPREAQEPRRTNLAARIPEPAIRARAQADTRGAPPVRGSGLAEALDVALALAEALFIILSLCIFATAAGAKTPATSRANRLARANLRMFLPYLVVLPACCT